MKPTPREPTPEMRTIGVVALRTVSDGDLDATTEEVAAVWRAIHDSAPSGWQPIETAPKDRTRVLVWIDDKSFTGHAFARPWFYSTDGRLGGGAEGFNGDWRITHWMPLPAPPSEKAQAAPSVPSVEQELLEKAAKAAGIKVLPLDGTLRDCTGFDPAMNLCAAPVWNPLTDDGDAFRLAVALGIADLGDFYDGDEADPYAATRLAIVRAAAAVRAKP